jgi:two-component system sensor histidine kinase AgrC
MVGVGVGNFVAPLIFALISDVNVTANTISHNIFLFTLMNFLIYLIASIFVVLTPFTKKLVKVKNLKPMGFLLCITILIMATNAGVHYITHFDPVSFTAVLLSSLVYLIASAWYITKYQKYESKIEEQNQQAFYNESLSNTLQDLRRFKHDQANHLSVIYAMLTMQKNTEAHNYLKEIINTSESVINTSIFNVKNAGLFGIISTKMDKASNIGVKFELDIIGEIDSIPNVKISELCEVVGIFLDNALEEVISNGKMKIEMEIKNTEEVITIKISNECIKIPNVNVTSKGHDRGNGILIAKKIINSYKNVTNATIFEKSNMTFSQILTIEKEA